MISVRQTIPGYPKPCQLGVDLVRRYGKVLFRARTGSTAVQRGKLPMLTQLFAATQILQVRHQPSGVSCSYHVRRTVQLGVLAVCASTSDAAQLHYLANIGPLITVEVIIMNRNLVMLVHDLSRQSIRQSEQASRSCYQWLQVSCRWYVKRSEPVRRFIHLVLLQVNRIKADGVFRCCEHFRRPYPFATRLWHTTYLEPFPYSIRADVVSGLARMATSPHRHIATSPHLSSKTPWPGKCPSGNLAIRASPDTTSARME